MVDTEGFLAHELQPQEPGAQPHLPESAPQAQTVLGWGWAIALVDDMMVLWWWLGGVLGRG